MGRFDFRKLFSQQEHDRTSIVAHLDALSNSELVWIRAFPFSITETRDWLFSYAGLLRSNTTVLRSTEGLTLVELRYRARVGGVDVRGKGRFFVLEHAVYPSVFSIITLETSSLFQQALNKAVRQLRPYVVLPFISHARLKRLVTKFKADFGYSDLIITQASQRLRLPEKGIHKRVMPVVTWPGMAVEEAFDWIQANNGWFQKIYFEARRGVIVNSKVALSRNGSLRTNRLFSQAYSAFLEPICKTHFENITLFAHRSRRERADLAVRPLSIDFPPDQFVRVEENAKLIAAMRSLKKASVSVLHGNPFVHLSVIDYVDASTFDVWVLNERQLVVVPQLKGTIAGIKRLINHIFDTYAEGDIRDFSGVSA